MYFIRMEEEDRVESDLNFATDAVTLQRSKKMPIYTFVYEPFTAVKPSPARAAL